LILKKKDEIMQLIEEKHVDRTRKRRERDFFSPFVRFVGCQIRSPIDLIETTRGYNLTSTDFR
jgi:hypothetical protein